MDMNNLLFIKPLILLLLSTAILFSAEPHNQVKIDLEYPSDQEMVINFSLDSIRLQVYSQNHNKFTLFKLAGLSSINIPGHPQLPVLAKNLNGYHKNIHTSLRIDESEIVTIDHPVPGFLDEAKGITVTTASADETIVTPFPGNILDTKYQGLVKNFPITTLWFYPIQLLSDQRVRIIKKASISIQFSNPPPVQPSTEASLTSLFDSPVKVAPPRTLNKSPLNPLFKKPFIGFEISRDGIYRINYKILKKAGLPVEQIDPQSLALYNRGKQIPIYVHGEKDRNFNTQDYIEFIGSRNPNSTGNTSEHDPFTDTNIYQLYWNIEKGLRFSLESVAPDYQGRDLIKPVEFDDLYHFEKNEKFQRLGFTYSNILSTQHDQYFFSRQVFSGSSENFEFHLPSPNTNTTKNIGVKVKLQSLSQYIDPTATILINGQNIGKSTWPWQSPGYIEQDPNYYIPNTLLKPGKNVLTINMEHNIQDQSAVIVLDWLEINYFRNFSAEEDYLEFHRPTNQVDGRYQFEIKEFSSDDIVIYKNGATKLTNFQKSYDSDNDSYSYRFQDEIAGATNYIAAGNDAIQIPDTCYLDTLHNILATDGCEHLCIVADKFSGSIQSLMKFYGEQEIDCYAVTVKDIYNQFNDGIKSPFAIKEFLKRAYETWTEFPKSCLLIGDANLNDSEADLLPTMLYQTYKWGGAASDYWYSLLNGDDNIPDIAIGRWACSTIKELERLIKKRIAYTKEPAAGHWRNKYLFIAGKEDAFKEQTDYFTQYNIKSPASISRILVNPSNVSSRFYGGTDTLVNRINRGLSFLNFVGHGGGAVWADRSLLRLEDLYQLNNDQYLPFITSFTCFTADFAASRSLGEEITEHSSGGAIGIFGSSGVGWVINDFLLAREILDNLQNDRLTIGEIIDIGKINYLTRYNHYGYLKNSMVYQYNLIGDPTIKLSLPDKTENYLKSDKDAYSPEESITLTGQLPFDEGNLELQIYDEQKYPITPVIPYYFTGENFSESIFLPDSAIKNGTINYTGVNQDNTSDFAGFVPFSFSQNHYKNLIISPASIDYNDSVSMTVKFLQPIDSLVWEIDTAATTGILQNRGIDTIYAFSGNAKSIHRIKCQQMPAGHYQAARPFIPKLSPRHIAYRLVWYRNHQKHSSSPQILHINKPMDIELLSLCQGGITFPAIEAEVFLQGNEKVPANFTTTIQTQDTTIQSSVTKVLTPMEKQKVFLPIKPKGHRINGSVKITSTNKEANLGNNSKHFNFEINHYQLTKKLGSSCFGQSNDTLWCDSLFFVFLPPNSIADSAVIEINSRKINKITQPDIKPSLDKLYHIGLSKELSFNNPAIIGFKGNRNDSKIIKYNSRLNGWIVTEYRAGTTEQTNPNGQYCLATVSDQQPPDVEINFDGQDILTQNYVDAFPMISFIFHDENGINFSEQTMKLFIDETPIPFNDLIYRDTLNNFTDVNCSYRSILESGTHDLYLSIQDAAGNITEDNFQFKIFKNLQIMDYGNYPNPFQTRTWFVFETTKNVEEFKINIYGTSGRKIRTIDDTNIFADKPMTASGYHEICWDGKDDFGDNIANGVYYYKMVAKTRNKTISKKGVIAKLK